MKKQASTTHFFYQNGKLVTVNQGGQQRAIFRTADMPLAEQQSEGTNGILVTDRSNSVLAVEDGEEEPDHTFTAYGHDPNIRTDRTLLGFNGEYIKPALGQYILGSGYRIYNTIIMRFNSPDNISPFGRGGINTYCYCRADPINMSDPSGHMSLRKLLLLREPPKKPRATVIGHFESFETPPPTYNEAQNTFIDRLINTSRNQATATKPNDVLPKFTARASEGQLTLDANFSGRNIRTTLSESDFSQQRELLRGTARKLGFDSHGFPLPGVSTDTMIDERPKVLGLALDSQVLFIRRTYTEKFERQQ